MEAVGIELTTYRMRSDRSTTELCPPYAADKKLLYSQISNFNKGPSIKNVQAKIAFFNPSLLPVQICPLSTDSLDVQFGKSPFAVSFQSDN